MAKTFSDAPHYSGAIGSDFRLGIQTGQTPSSSGGLAEMMNIKASELRAYMREGMASVYNYRGEYNTLPTDLAVGDAFYCSSTFTSGGHTYTQGHLYAWNGTSWDDITNIFSQYAQQGQVNDIDTRLTDAEVKIDAMGDGIVVKGDCTYAELIAIVDPEVGWEYWVTDMNSFYLYSEDDGWIAVDAGIVQTPDTTDTSHALSNAKTTQMITDVKNACKARDSALNKRVTNLEQKAGDELTVNYPDSIYGMDGVPANVAEYAKVTKLRGVSRVENSLITEATKTGSAEGLSYSRVNNHVTVTGTYQSGGDSNAYIFSNDVMPEINGHNYLVFVTNPKFSLYIFGATTAGVQNAIVFPATASGQMQLTARATGFSNGATVNESFDVIVRDLTLYFNGTIPSDADTIAEIQQNYPELLIPSDYDAGSLVSTTYSGVKSVGVNIWDEEWESGSIDGTTGQNIPNASLFRSKNYIEVSSATDYFFTTRKIAIYEYDANKNFMGGTPATNEGEGYKVSPSATCRYLRFRSSNYGSTTYNNNIQICLDSLPSSVKTNYHPYQADTLTLPTPITLRSAGSVAEEFDLESGEKTNPLGSVDLGTLNWTYSDEAFYTADLASIVQKPETSSVLGNYICDLLTQKTGTDGWSNYKYNFAQNKNLWARTDGSTTNPTTFAQSLSGVMLYFELATPNAPTQLTPVLDPFVKVEGGGTIRPTQTQTTEIDSAMTAEYLSLGA